MNAENSASHVVRLKAERGNKYRVYYRSGTGGRCCICARQTIRVHLPGGSSSAWNDVVDSILKVWRQIENPTPSIDAIYSKNIPLCRLSWSDIGYSNIMDSFLKILPLDLTQPNPWMDQPHVHLWSTNTNRKANRSL